MKSSDSAAANRRPSPDDPLDILRIDPARKRRRRVLSHPALWIVLSAALGAGVGLRAWKPQLEVSVARAVLVDSTASTSALTAGGYVVAPRTAELSPKITDRIEWIGVDKGDHVKKGQVLIVLDQAVFNAQVAQRKSSLAAAQAQLQELRAGSRAEEIEEAQAMVVQARSDVAMASLHLSRTGQLVEQGLLARQAHDEARNQHEVATAKLRAASERLRLVQAGPRPEQIERARAAVREAEANVDLAVANLNDTVIRAPADGTILERLAQVGETVTPNVLSQRGAKSAILLLADLTDLAVEVEVNEADLKKLRLDMPATVIPDAYPDRSYHGTLVQMAPQANRQKATLAVRVRIDKPDAMLRPEMGAKVLFQSAPPRDTRPVVVVPSDAIVMVGDTPVVYVVIDGRGVAQPVTVVQRSGGDAMVGSGLRGDERVIVRAAGPLHDGQAVRIIP